MKWFIVLTTVAVGVVLLYTHMPISIDVLDLLNEYGGYALFGLFLVPVVTAFVAVLSLVAHPDSYQYNPVENRAPKEQDPLAHTAVGFLLAVLHDFSTGQIAEPLIYSPDVLRMLEQELQRFSIYFDRQYEFHFQFHHEETYRAHISYQLSDSEYVMEVDGLFDYYFERNGQQHRTPHAYDQSQPLIRIPGIARLRLQKDIERELWKLTGFSENIRGVHLGLPTK